MGHLRAPRPGRPLIGFSTLACPEWSALEVVDRAVAMGADGIEWRGGPEGHAGPSLPVASRRRLRRAMENHGLIAIAVTAYTTFVSPDPTQRAASVDDLLRHAEVAADLGAGSVRVFLGERADDAPEAQLLDRAAEALATASARLRGSGVAIAIEPHDEFVASPAVVPLLERLADPSIGVIWDIGNTWSVGEAPATGLSLLRPWLRYVQVKDGIGRGATWRLTSIGRGEVPIRDAVVGLLAGGPVPPLSIEWERPWHPELPPASEALPAGVAYLRELLDQAAINHEET